MGQDLGGRTDDLWSYFVDLLVELAVDVAERFVVDGGLAAQQLTGPVGGG